MTGIGDFVHAAGQYGSRFLIRQQQHGIEHRVLKGGPAMDEGVVVSCALKQQGDLCANGIVRGLDKRCRLKRLFPALDDALQEKPGVFQATVCGACDDRVRSRDLRRPQATQCRSRAHPDDPAHAADHFGVQQGPVVRLPTMQTDTHGLDRRLWERLPEAVLRGNAGGGADIDGRTHSDRFEKTREEQFPPKPNELDNTCRIGSPAWNSVSGTKGNSAIRRRKRRFGYTIPLVTDSTENTASIPPLAPSVWPVKALVEL